jgi:hypothetical protein
MIDPLSLSCDPLPWDQQEAYQDSSIEKSQDSDFGAIARAAGRLFLCKRICKIGVTPTAQSCLFPDQLFYDYFRTSKKPVR